MAIEKEHLRINLTVTEKEIIRAIHVKCGAMTINEIAKDTGIAYSTAKKYVDSLYTKDVVLKML